MSFESFSNPPTEPVQETSGFLDHDAFNQLLAVTERPTTGGAARLQENNEKTVRAIEAGSADDQIEELLTRPLPGTRITGSRNIHVQTALINRVATLIQQGNFDDKLGRCLEIKAGTLGAFMSIVQAARARREVLNGTK